MTMCSELRQAVEGLEREKATLYVVGESRYSATSRGIAPIMEVLQKEPALLHGAYVADKVTGRAAALLLIKGGIAGLHTELISTLAREILEQSGVALFFVKEVPAIRNRTGDGLCPMESAVRGVHDPERAYEILLEAVQKMAAAH